VNPGEPLTKTYVNKYFEVRENNAPTKYVWNADTPVSRVSGSLSLNARVRRVRLFSGWNLISIALKAFESDNLRIVSTNSFRWTQSALDWNPVLRSETLGSGTVLWLHSRTAITAKLFGDYVIEDIV
jgi:hypothetical protein